MNEAIGWAILGLMLYGYQAIVCAIFAAFMLQAAVRLLAKFKLGYGRAFLITLLGYAILLAMWFLIFMACSTSGMTPDQILGITLIPGIFTQTALCLWLLKSKDEKKRITYGSACLISVILLSASVGIYLLLHPVLGILLDRLGIM